MFYFLRKRTYCNGKIASEKIEESINSEILFVSKSEINEYTRRIDNKIFYNGGLFIANAFNGNGKCPIRFTTEKCVHSNLMFKLNIKNDYKDRINIKYIYHFLKSLQEHIEKNYQKGACNQSLDTKNFNRMKIQIPSIIQQNKCIKSINEMEKIIKRWINDINDILNNGCNKFLDFLESEYINFELGNDKKFNILDFQNEFLFL